MANEISIRAKSGWDLYAIRRRNSDKWVWNGSGYEVPNEVNWVNYVIPLIEQGSTGYFFADDPDPTTPGGYDVYRILVTNPDSADSIIGAGDLLIAPTTGLDWF